MKGRVDNVGRALIEIAVRHPTSGAATKWTAWIDTGFSGELVAPLSLIQQLGLESESTAYARLATGVQVSIDLYRCKIDWLTGERDVEVVSSDGQVTLLGVGLLYKHKLTINYPARTVTLK